MIRMLLVDDEDLVLKGLSHILDWTALGVQIVGSADSGCQALQMAQNLRPDIIITDIRMPEISGIELIQRVKKELPETKCIILSGYQDFQYAKDAMKYGALGYLVKPVDEEELKNLVLSAKDSCLARSKERGTLNELNSKLHTSMAFSRNQLLYSIASGELRSRTAAQAKLEQFDIEPLPERFVCTVLEMEITDLKKDFLPDEDMEILRFAVANIADDVIRTHTTGQVFYMLKNQVIALIHVEKGLEDATDSILRDIVRYSQQCLMIPVTLGVSDIHQGFEGIRVSFQEAKSALKYKILEGSGNILHYRGENAGIHYNAPVWIEKQLTSSIISGDTEDITQIINMMCEEFAAQKYLTDDKIRSECIGILHLIRKSLRDLSLNTDGISHLISELAEIEIVRLDTLEDYLDTSLIRAAKDISKQNRNGTKLLVLQIKEYIDANYSDKLSLNNIAEKFFINTSYASRLFKKEFSHNFVDYLTERRIEEAKKLLTNSDMRIYEISESIGYNSPKYFCSLFEKMVQMTPSEYRANHRKEKRGT